MFKKIFTFSLFLIIFTSGYAQQNTQTSLAPMLKNTIPAVVNIKSTGKLPPTVYLKQSKKNNKDADDDRDIAKQRPIEKPFASLGSGVIVDAKNGYVLTNAHVIKDADKTVVTLHDGHQYNAKVIGEDDPSDVAVLQIKAPGLQQLTMSNSNNVKVGDYVVAIGNPFGLGQSVTSGVVSALGRADLQLENYENFIQIDAPINPGNSGGALVNMKGEMIGMNTAMLSPDGGGNIGIGFSIPTNMIKEVYKQLIKYGKVERGVIGVIVQTLKPDLASALNIKKTKGAIVSTIVENSSAQKAGVKTGDIITQVNGVDVETNNQVVNAIGFLRVGSKAKLTISRNGNVLNLDVLIMDSKKQNILDQQSNPYLYGMGLQEFDQYNPLFGNVKGLGIVGVLPDSNAWSAGLHTGDIIVNANDKPVTTVEQLQAIAKTSKESLVLHIYRDKSAAYIVLKPPVISEKKADDKGK